MRNILTPFTRKGFSFIEVMVTLTIVIAIVLLVTPKFTSSSAASEDLLAQNSADSLLSASINALYNTGSFYVTDAALGSSLDPELITVDKDTASTSHLILSTAISTSNDAIAVAVKSKTGICWYAFKSMGVADNTLSEVYAFSKAGSSSICSAQTALTNLSSLPSNGPGGGWSKPFALS